MREPSIHITKSKFIELFKQITNKELTDKQIKGLFSKARSYSLDNRLIMQQNNGKIINTINKRIKSNIGDANLLTSVIYSIRVKLKHIGVKKIVQADTQWTQIKELVPIINSYCESVNITYRKGYIMFIEMAFELMSQVKRVNYNYCASWILKNSDKIISYLEAKLAIKEDKYPEETLHIYNIYIDKVLSMTGIQNNYIKDPLAYYNFILARETADSIGIDYEMFIESQFDALAFCNGIPRIEDLNGEKAKQRLTQYLSKNNITIHNRKSDNNIEWDSFKS